MKKTKDRTGLSLSFVELQPLGAHKEPERFWLGTIVMTSSQLELPEVPYKLRVNAKRGVDPRVTCNKSQGIVKQNEGVILSYQLPESSIEHVRMTLVVDGSPYAVPLYKKELAEPLLSPRIIESPGKIDHISDGLKDFMIGNKGFERVCKVLHPHAISLFHDLSTWKLEQFEFHWERENAPNAHDVIAEEIVKRFHEANRKTFPTTPKMMMEAMN